MELSLFVSAEHLNLFTWYKKLQLMNKSLKLYALYTGRSFMLEYDYTCAIVNVVDVHEIRN